MIVTHGDADGVCAAACLQAAFRLTNIENKLHVNPVPYLKDNMISSQVWISGLFPDLS